MADPIQVGVLEDDPDMRAYLEHILTENEDMHVVFAAGTVSAAEAALATDISLDICLVDLQLPDGSGADFVRHMLEKCKAKALILTVLGDQVSVLTALRVGAHGYLLKDTPPQQILSAIRNTVNGANPISPQAATHLLKMFQTVEAAAATEKSGPPSTLTPRETDILRLFAKGMSYKEAARALGISPYTVGDYVKSIYSKLSVNSRNEAVFEALQMGWIEI